MVLSSAGGLQSTNTHNGHKSTHNSMLLHLLARGYSCGLVANLPNRWRQPHVIVQDLLFSHNPLQPLLCFPQAQHASHQIVGLAHPQPNSQKLNTAFFLTNIKAPAHMGQIVSSSMPVLTAMGGILFHPVQPNLPVNPLSTSHCLPHNPQRADTLLPQGYSYDSSQYVPWPRITKISTYFINY